MLDGPEGKVIFLDELLGSDDDDGASPECAFATMEKVRAAMTLVAPGAEITLVMLSSGECKYDICTTLGARQGKEE